MLLYLIITFILFINCLALNPLPSGARPNELRLLSLGFWKQISLFPISRIRNMTISNVEAEINGGEMSVLDLPALALESILEKLPPSGLCNMAGVCTSLRERCVGDHFWEKHMKQKWSKLVGPAAYRKWQSHLASGKDSSTHHLKQGKQRLCLKLFSFFSSLSLVRSKVHDTSKPITPLPVGSIMSWYLALETGRFWFPAQVYNRENGHVGFMLSCYDAEICYDQSTDTFQARYPSQGKRVAAMESGVPWERLRAAPVDSSPRDLHISDCLNELHPGDHIEIQWRRNKEFPYGWWYGVVGHLESCDGDGNLCRCHNSDKVILEFNQYTPGSRWRKTTINRKDHREEGNEADGFYGGIRKINSEDEIKMWKRLWPVEVLE